MLNEAERALPRRIRRALISDRRTLIKKRTPFGRVKVMAFEVGEAPQDERTTYTHFTKGNVDRRTTLPLLNDLIAIG